MRLEDSIRRFQNKLDKCSYVQSCTVDFSGKFKFNRVKVLYVDGMVRLFFYNSMECLMFSCFNYDISRIDKGVIYINC